MHIAVILLLGHPYQYSVMVPFFKAFHLHLVHVVLLVVLAADHIAAIILSSSTGGVCKVLLCSLLGYTGVN